jgi:flagellar FliL protein
MSSPQGQPPATAPSRSGGKKWLVLAAVGSILAGGGVVALQRRGKPTEQAQTKPVAFEPGVVELEPFVLNLADPAGDRYFRLTLRLVLDQRAIAERAAGGLGQVKLRDRVLSILSRKRAGDVTSLEGKERLRAEILAACEALLAEQPFHEAASDPAPARVVDVLFMEFLVQ